MLNFIIKIGIKRAKPIIAPKYPVFDCSVTNTNAHENIEYLIKKEFNVWMSDIYSFNDVFKMITGLGVIFEKERQAKTLVSKIKSVKILIV